MKSIKKIKRRPSPYLFYETKLILWTNRRKPRRAKYAFELKKVPF